MPSQEIDYQKLVPRYWSKIHIRTMDELVFLGSDNLRYLANYWKRQREKTDKFIELSHKRSCSLSNMTMSDIKALAAKYEHPTFPDVRIGYSREPEPFDEDSVNREFGATTFNFCGWCKYCFGGVIRYRTRIVTTCGLLPRYFYDEGGRRIPNEKLRFDDPCLIIKHGSQNLLNLCLSQTRSNTRSYSVERDIITNYLDVISSAISRSSRKPCFAAYRPRGWFNVDDVVICFVSDGYDGGEVIKSNIFVTGRIIKKHRGSDSSVLVLTNEDVYSDPKRQSNELFYRVSRPEIMQGWEFEYLKSNPDYLRVWMAGSAFTPKFDFDAF